MPDLPRLTALATAVPPYALGQADVARRAQHLFSGADASDLDRLMPVFANAGIDRRYSCVPIDWYEHAHGWAERNALYLENADAPARAGGARRARPQAGLEPEEIDAMVASPPRGIATPSLDARADRRLGLRRDVRRLPIFGLGCAGGVSRDRARRRDRRAPQPGARVLFLVVELCALSFRKNDVARRATSSRRPCSATAPRRRSSRADGAGPALGAGGEYTWPQSLDVMGWDVAEDGLKALFSRDIPTLVRAGLRDVDGGVLRAPRARASATSAISSAIPAAPRC